MGNQNFINAKKEKNDEFYTRLQDIEKEVFKYKEHFKDKVVLCNCDDPRVSQFFNYFFLNFKFFGLKKLIATCYKNQEWNLFSDESSEKAVYIVYDGRSEGNMPDDKDIVVRELNGDGDFRSPECKAFLELADIVVTNPPFSLFREFVSLMEEYEKKYLIIGNKNAIICKEIFPLFKENKLWLGVTAPDEFYTPDKNVTKKVNGLSRWFTNLPIKHTKESVILYKKYKPEEYPKYDNYDAIEVSTVKNIPMDYNGIMGVPISFLHKYNPEQFEIIGLERYIAPKEILVGGRLAINGKSTYARILIRFKKGI